MFLHPNEGACKGFFIVFHADFNEPLSTDARSLERKIEFYPKRALSFLVLGFYMETLLKL